MGQNALALAGQAHALDLYCLGRFREALAAARPAQADTLATRCLLMLGEISLAQALAASSSPHERVLLAYLGDDPPVCAKACDEASIVQADVIQTDQCTVLRAWAEPDPSHLGAAQRVIARQRQHAPALAAASEAAFAEAQWHRAPRWSVVWLDYALDQCERYSQHTLKARLLMRKSLALDAAGELGEAARFLKLAQALQQRQRAPANQPDQPPVTGGKIATSSASASAADSTATS